MWDNRPFDARDRLPSDRIVFKVAKLIHDEKNCSENGDCQGKGDIKKLFETFVVLPSPELQRQLIKVFLHEPLSDNTSNSSSLGIHIGNLLADTWCYKEKFTHLFLAYTGYWISDAG
jgi:hypothetical protein